MKVKITNFNDKTKTLPNNSEIKVMKKTATTETTMDIADIQIKSTFDGRTRQWSVCIYVSDSGNPQ